MPSRNLERIDPEAAAAAEEQRVAGAKRTIAQLAANVAAIKTHPLAKALPNLAALALHRGWDVEEFAQRARRRLDEKLGDSARLSPPPKAKA